MNIPETRSQASAQNPVPERSASSAHTHETHLEPYGSLFHPVWRECGVYLMGKQAVLLMHDIYIPPTFVHNPNNKYNPKYMPLTIFNLNKVDHLYIGRDTIVTFADIPEFETYNLEIVSEDKIREHLAKPRNWVPQRHETLSEIPSDTAFICSQADVPGHHKVHLQDKQISGVICQRFEELCEEYGQALSKHWQNKACQNGC